MKITKQRLREIIKEELSEAVYPDKESADYHGALGAFSQVLIKLQNLDARDKDILLDSEDIKNLRSAFAYFKSIKPPTFEQE